MLGVRSDPDFRVELDETRSLHPPSRPPRTFKTTLSFVRTHYDAHPIAHVKASHRSKSLSCSSETESDLRDDTVTNASRYLGAVRAGHDEPSARSPSFALLEIPGLGAVRRSRWAVSICASKIRIFASEGTKQGRNNHCTKVFDLGRPGVHGGAQAGIALLPTSRSPRSRVTLAFLWGRGAASLVGPKRLQPQHARRQGRSGLWVPRERSGSGRTRAASPDSAAQSASLLRLERPSNDEAPKRT